MFRKAWQIYTECRLIRRTATIVSLYPIVIGCLFVVVGTVCSFVGGLTGPYAEPSDFGDFVMGLAIMLVLFYPFHIVGMGLGVGALLFVRKLPVVVLDEKRVLTFSEFVFSIEEKVYQFLSYRELRVAKSRLIGGRNWVVFGLLFLMLVCVGGYVAEGRYFALGLLIIGSLWFLSGSRTVSFSVLSQSRYFMIPLWLGLILTFAGLGGYIPLIIGLGLTLGLSVWQGILKYPYELRMAFRYFSAGKLVPALQSTNLAIEKRSDCWAAYQLRSGINSRLFRMIPAEKDARIALRLKPNAHLSYQALGASLVMQERYVEAESAYIQALSLMPKYGMHHFNRGIVSYRLGNLDEAEKFFQTTLHHRLPFTQINLLASYYLARIVEMKGEQLRARHLYIKLRQFHSGYKQLAIAYQDAPDYPAVSLMREELEDIKKYIEQ